MNRAKRLMQECPGTRAGAALILVVVVIAALVAISAPFAISMRLHEKSARGYSYRVKARGLAGVASRDAWAAFISLHEDEKRRARLARPDPNGDDEDADSRDELWPHVRDLTGSQREQPGLPPLLAHSTKSTMYDVACHDERGKIDVNTCNAEVLANLLGVTVTTDELTYEETKTIHVEDTSQFYSDGDPTTLDGVVRVQGEFIGYCNVTPHPTAQAPHAGSLDGLIRGMYFSRQPPPEDTGGLKARIAAGTLVQDFRGWKIAWDGVWRWNGTDRKNELARFETASAIRKIADWEFGTFAYALYAAANGVTFDKLREWGITKEKLELAGVADDTAEGKGAHEKAAADAQKRLQEAEKGLREFGVDPSLLRSFGGNPQKAIIGTYETLKSLDSDQVANYVAKLKERSTKHAEQQAKNDSFWRGEVKRQIDELIALREKNKELEAIGRVELERIRPWITVDSLPDGEAWSDPQAVNHAVRYEPYDPFAKLRIQDGRRFRAGALVRVRPILPPGATSTGAASLGKPEYRRCLACYPTGPDHWEVRIFPQLENDYEESTIDISCQQPRPLNVNAASREVLIAALTGLQTPLFQKQSATGQTAPNFVTPEEAAKIAERIMNASSLRSHKDLKTLLDDAKTANEIDDGDEEAILLNAVDPGSRLLAHGTVPFCYKSSGNYEIVGTGILNDEAQNEVARVKTREIVETAPPHDLVWVIDSQKDYQDRLSSNGVPGSGAAAPGGGAAPVRPNAAFMPAIGQAFVRGRWASLLDTYPVDISVLPWQFPDRTHSGTAMTKLAMSRDYENPRAQANAQPGGNVQIQVLPGTVLYAEHYDQEREGHKLADDVDLTTGQLAARGFPIEDSTVRIHLGPGTLRGWFKVDKLTGSARTYIYDGGKGDHNSRICLFYDEKGSPTSGPALVAQVYDESLDTEECAAVGKPPRPTVEAIAPIKQLVPENWYHIALAWKGGERGDLAIVLDGKLVSKEATGTRTTAPIDGFAGTINVETTAGFPDHGWIRLGGYRRPDGTLAGDLFTHNPPTGPWDEFQDYGEVLYYSSKTATSFNCGVDPSLWIKIYKSRYPNAATIPNPPAPFDNLPAARIPLRGSGRYLQIPDPSGAVPFEVRLGVAHDSGAPITLFGYTEWAKNGNNWVTRWINNMAMTPKLQAYQETIRKGGATLAQPLPENTPFTMVYKFPCQRDAKQNFVAVQPGDTDIPTLWCGAYPDNGTPSLKLKKQPSIGGFPPQGYIRVGNERIFYRHLDPQARMFRNCIRGIDGTGAQIHYLWEGVALESILVSDMTDYPDRPTMLDPAVYVQLTPQLTPGALSASQDPLQESLVEWVSVMKGDPTLGNYLIMPCFYEDIVSTKASPPYSLTQNGRFELTPQLPGYPPGPKAGTQDPGFTILGDQRWLQALFNQWATGQGNLGMNPGNLVLTVPATPLGGKPPPPAVPPLVDPPLDSWQLKEFLKQMEPNLSRAKKGTVKWSTLWTQTAPLAPSMGYMGTSAGGGRPHLANEKVIPTFITGAPSPSAANNSYRSAYMYAGKGDVVTITDDTGTAPEREERTIAWVGIDPFTRAHVCDAGIGGPGGTLNGDFGTGQIMAFDDFVQRPYLATDYARIVRFPSGQLPVQLLGAYALDVSVGRARKASGPSDVVADAPGNFEGYVDEVIASQEGEPAIAEDNLRVDPAKKLKDWPQPPMINAGDTNYETCKPPDGVFTQALRAGILFKLDDELLACRETGASTLGQGLSVVRGMLGTQADTHMPESLLWWNFPLPKIAVCQSGFDPLKGNYFTIRQRPGAAAVPGLAPGDVINDKNFYVAIDRGQAQGGLVELLPVRYRRQSQLFRPRDRFDRGCFRGAFGSGIASPDLSPGDVLFDYPFRYHDRYQNATSSLEGVFFQATKEVAGGYFESVTWDVADPNPFTKTIIAVRVDGEPSWDADPAMKLQPGQKGRLYVFDDPKAANQILLKGDRVEVRAYMTYKPRAFMEDAWKQTPILKAIRLTYRQPTRVRRREEMQE